VVGRAQLQQKTTELQRLRADHESATKELVRLRKTVSRLLYPKTIMKLNSVYCFQVTGLGSENRRLSDELQTSKDYVKKLESKLVHGSSGQVSLL
jgi:predicted RNase H-like nuclease (RuvC/YqgF family)